MGTFKLATRGDLDTATRGDFLMATDSCSSERGLVPRGFLGSLPPYEVASLYEPVWPKLLALRI
jgi:hypothetical protein